MLFAALSIVLLTATIYTYDRLTAETLIAELRFDATGERQYVAHLRTGDRCDERTFPVLGDQWRVDAEFLKWKYWALLLGLDSQYRLDRLEGRYRSAAEQNSQPNVAHDLSERTAVDLVALAESLGSWNFLLDATYGSSTYQDIDVDNVYYVYRTHDGHHHAARAAARAAAGRRAVVDHDRRRVRRAVVVAPLHRSGPTTTSSRRSISSDRRPPRQKGKNA